MAETSIDDEWNQFIIQSSMGNDVCDTGDDMIVDDDISDDDANSDDNGDDNGDGDGDGRGDVNNEFGVRTIGSNNGNGKEFSLCLSSESVASSPFRNMAPPAASELYISTKSKIGYLDKPVDLSVFWKIHVIPYHLPKNGVLKKQIKINSKTKEDLAELQTKLEKEVHYNQLVITHIDNPNGRIKFRDVRKITIGISKKDIMTLRTAERHAFYNCFVMILRLKIHGIFKEFHIKVFNTGKLEMPGIQNDEIYYLVLDAIVNILQPFYDSKLSYCDKSDTVLINSNFNCGFYINREVLIDILKQKYNIQAIYDPCTYPGVQCKFYYNNEPNAKQTGLQPPADSNISVTTVSFMIFRTGSVLIVGMCEEYVLVDIYNFLKVLFQAEFANICHSVIDADKLTATKDKKKKTKRMTISINMSPPV